MEKRRAFVTGASGQSASYLIESLLRDDYEVVGLVRRQSTEGTLWRLADVIDNPNLTLEYGDITDSNCLFDILLTYKPDEIYNLAAQSHVGISYENPKYTFEVTAGGCLNLLDAFQKVCPEARFYQAGSSEQFGTSTNEDGFQDIYTEFHPVSPYAVAKVAAHQMVKMYRESYGLHASVGVLMNHESPRRGDNFVTQKIVKYVVSLILAGNKRAHPKLELGNLDSHRDWGYAKDYVEAMRLMLAQEHADDYVIATGQTYTIRDFLDTAFSYADLPWRDYVIQSAKFMRPNEVPYLRGDASKARQVLGWKPKTDFYTLVEIMMKHEMEKAKAKAS